MPTARTRYVAVIKVGTYHMSYAQDDHHHFYWIWQGGMAETKYTEKSEKSMMK